MPDRKIDEQSPTSTIMDFYDKIKKADGLIIRESDNYDLIIEVADSDFSFYWVDDTSGTLFYDGHSVKCNPRRV